MKPAMYIVLNKGLKMSTGKAAAQAGHAAVRAAFLSLTHPFPHGSQAVWEESNLFRLWNKGGHYAKYVMEARDRDHLLDIERYINDQGFKTALIIDEGHTEVEPLVPTALGVELVDKDDPHVAATFSSLDLYREPPVEPLAIIELDRLREDEITTIRERLAAGESPQTVSDLIKAKRDLQRPHERKRRRIPSLRGTTYRG